MVNTSTPKHTSKDKFILKSKTVQGLILVTLPTLAVLFGFSFTDEDKVLFTQTSDALIQLIGGLWAFYGRLTVKEKIRV